MHITTTKTKNFDEVTGMTNHALREIFAYRFDENISELVVENGKSLGFEAWPIDTVLGISKEDKARFIPSILSEEVLDIFRKIDKLI